MLDIGDEAPDFSLPSDDGSTVSLKDFRGRKVVLYFYPKDSTPGCTREACDFRDNMARIQSRGAVVLGVSRDSLKSHRKFRNKYDLSFPLLSDSKEEAVTAYGVLAGKTNLGRILGLIQRSTFIIDEAGRIQKVYRKVRVKGHVEQVLADLG